MFYVANDIVTRLGLEESLTLAVAIAAACAYLATNAFGWTLGKTSLRWIYLLPAFAAFLLAVRSYRQQVHIWDLLEQAGAISEPQLTLFSNMAVHGVARLLVLGLVLTLSLRHLNRWQVARSNRRLQADIGSAATSGDVGEKEHAKPV